MASCCLRGDRRFGVVCEVRDSTPNAEPHDSGSGSDSCDGSRREEDPIKLANVVGDLITVLAVILLIRWVWKRREKRALVPTATPPQ